VERELHDLYPSIFGKYEFLESCRKFVLSGIELGGGLEWYNVKLGMWNLGTNFLCHCHELLTWMEKYEFLHAD